jgi:hypothetical protein
MNHQNICESTIEERDLLDGKLVDFNRGKVPFEQTEEWISLSYVSKDDAGLVVAGINATLYCWNIMYVDILYVDEAPLRSCGRSCEAPGWVHVASGYVRLAGEGILRTSGLRGFWCSGELPTGSRSVLYEEGILGGDRSEAGPGLGRAAARPYRAGAIGIDLDREILLG